VLRKNVSVCTRAHAVMGARLLRRVLFALGLACRADAVASEPLRLPSIFDPVSPPAQAVYELSLLIVAVCAGIFLVVGGLLAYAIVRYRRPADDDGREPPQVYGSNQIELAWTVLPLLIVFTLLLVTTRTIIAVQNAPPPPAAVQVQVIGHQWWWEFRYPEHGIVTANELHVPVSDAATRRPTYLALESADVIHSFWVPQLAGKTDLIPNRANRMWIEPLEPGLYIGQCAEYCGTQHAKMLLRVIAHEPAEFDRWVASQQQAAASVPDATAGRAVFEQTACINCHRIAGTVADGRFGPDLTHLMSRATLGAGAARNTADNLRRWVHDPQTLKPGCNMPAMNLTEAELDAVVGYLATLH
jgi:cytochrome c oxidase subunit 2